MWVKMKIETKKIAIIGSRTYKDVLRVYNILDYLKTKHISFKIISGGASGVDTYAYNWCKLNDYQIEVIRPINTAIKINYLFRNIEIITKVDKIIAFWDGKSSGTKFVIDYAKARNKELEIIYDNMG